MNACIADVDEAIVLRRVAQLGPPVGDSLSGSLTWSKQAGGWTPAPPGSTLRLPATRTYPLRKHTPRIHPTVALAAGMMLLLLLAWFVGFRVMGPGAAVSL